MRSENKMIEIPITELEEIINSPLSSFYSQNNERGLDHAL